MDDKHIQAQCMCCAQQKARPATFGDVRSSRPLDGLESSHLQREEREGRHDVDPQIDGHPALGSRGHAVHLMDFCGLKWL